MATSPTRLVFARPVMNRSSDTRPAHYYPRRRVIGRRGSRVLRKNRIFFEITCSLFRRDFPPTETYDSHHVRNVFQQLKLQSRRSRQRFRADRSLKMNERERPQFIQSLQSLEFTRDRRDSLDGDRQKTGGNPGLSPCLGGRVMPKQGVSKSTECTLVERQRVIRSSPRSAREIGFGTLGQPNPVPLLSL